MLHAAPVIPETSPEHAPEQAPEEPRVARRRDRQHDDEANALVDAARYYLNHDTRGFRDDCSGFIEAVYARAGTPVHGSTAALWEQARARGATHRDRLPRPGDLAFFDNTYDRNGNGRRDDPLTHVAIVLEVDDDGTILLAHGGTSRGRTTLHMNLRDPNVQTSDRGDVMNDYLRRRDLDAPASTPRLAGQLWRGFATWDGRDATTSDATPSKRTPLPAVGGGTTQEAT